MFDAFVLHDLLYKFNNYTLLKPNSMSLHIVIIMYYNVLDIVHLLAIHIFYKFGVAAHVFFTIFNQRLLLHPLNNFEIISLRMICCTLLFSFCVNNFDNIIYINTATLY